ncbi:MAG: hypothetical protein KGN34_17005 [Sphingomonadales bacterium]|nr:hypothetical protein [Sphingomonadales bacterium]
MIRHLFHAGMSALFLMLSSFSVAAAPALFFNSIENTRAIGAFALQGDLFHVQGLVLEPGRIWVTSVDLDGHRGFLHEFDRATGRPLRRLELTDGARYHAGGISMSGRSIWVPVAENRPHSSAVLMEIDADTLTVRRRIAVPDHLGCVAASGTTLVAGNWDSELLYMFDPASGALVRTVRNPSATHFQDMKLANGQLVAGGNLNWWSGTVDWIDLTTMTVKRSLRAGAVGRLKPIGRGGPLTGEGMAVEGRDLYVIPEDGPGRVLRFRML